MSREVYVGLDLKRSNNFLDLYNFCYFLLKVKKLNKERIKKRKWEKLNGMIKL